MICLSIRHVIIWPRLTAKCVSQVALVVKNVPANSGDVRDRCSIPELGRSPEEGHGNPLQYSGLENPIVRGTWQATSRWGWKESKTTERISVQFSCSVVSDSLWPYGLRHARPPCPSPTPGIYSNSCPLSWWCHPTILPFVIPFSSRLQSFPASGSFKWVGSSHQVAKVLEFQLQHQSFQWIFRTDFL